jgi:hypothetical protein
VDRAPLRSPRGIEALGSPVFVFAVALLVANDFVLKPAFHNALTGKLSDFAGLAAFTIFLCAFCPDRRGAIAAGVTVAFVFWKSPVSQGLIDSVNAFSPVVIGRTVDATDLIALPAAWWVCASWPVRAWPARRWLLQALAGVSVLAFTATSMPIYRYEIRQAVDFSDATPSDEAELQRIIDDVAARHKLRCRICGPLSSGRSYDEELPRAWGFTLTVSLEPGRKRLVYDLRNAAQGEQPDRQQVEALRADLERTLRSRFPGMVVTTEGYPRKENLTLVVLSGDSSGSYASRQNQADAERTAALVAEVAAAHDMRRIGATGDFYAGRLLGPDRYDREMTVMVSVLISGDIYIHVAYASPEYRKLRLVVADAIERRLRTEFGARRVAFRPQP